MKFTISMVALLAALSTAYAGAEPKLDPGCTPANAPAEAFDKNMTFSETIPYAPCDTENLGYRVRKAMVTLGQMKGFDGDTRFRKSIIGKDPASFVTSRTDLLEIGPASNKNCDLITNGYFETHPVDQFYRKPLRVMNICPPAAHRTQLGLMALLLHEARHADGKSHVRCAVGSMSMLNIKACDPAVDDGGSYWVSAEFFLTAAKNPQLTPAERQEARAESIYYLVTRFNKLPKDLNFVSIMFPEKGGVSAFDGRQEHVLLKSLPPGYQVAWEPGYPTLINRTSGNRLSYTYRANTFSEAKDGVLSSFDANLRKQLIDVAAIGDMQCYLFPKKMTCWRIDYTSSTTLTFSNFEAKRFAVMDQRFGQDDDTVIAGPEAYVVDTKGRALTMKTSYTQFQKDPDFTNYWPAMDPLVEMFADVVFFPPAAGFPYEVLTLSRKTGLVVGFKPKVKRTDAYVSDRLTNLNWPMKRILGPSVWSPLLETL